MVCIAWYEAAGTLPPPLPTTVNSVPPDCMVPRTSGGLQLSWVLVLTSWPPTSWLLLAKGAGEIPTFCDFQSQREIHAASPVHTHTHAHLWADSECLKFLGADTCRPTRRSLGSNVGLSAQVCWGLPSLWAGWALLKSFQSK